MHEHFPREAEGTMNTYTYLYDEFIRLEKAF